MNNNLSRSIIIKNPLGSDYEISLNTDFSSLKKCLEESGIENLSPRKICIVTDSKVGPLYADSVKKQLESVFSRVDVFTFPMGEENKTLDTVRELYKYLIDKHYDRKDILAALGGGVTGDLCGYASATYLRGIDFIQIPTTLLSQVDSSIGGKTGVDFDSYKNMVGAFHMPRLVYMNISTLDTLDKRQFSCGMGEILKHGFIKNGTYLQWIIDHKSQILSLDKDALLNLVYESCLIKGSVVEEDPTETGIRAHLNFGHTLGHAIEKLMDFKLLHGECVALGIAAASYISQKRGLISKDQRDIIIKALKEFDLNVNLDFIFERDPSIDKSDFINRVITYTKSDKKAEHGSVKFVLLKNIGEAFTDRTVTEDEMKEALASLIS